MLRRICVTVAGAAVLLVGSGSAWAAGPAGAAGPSACSGVIRIDGLAFSPVAVAPGGSATAVLTATNCTAQAQAVTEQWTGDFSSLSGTGVPAGCPVIDPLLFPRTFPAGSQATSATTYTVPVGCTADRLTVTVRLTQGATVLGTAGATLIIDQPSAG